MLIIGISYYIMIYYIITTCMYVCIYVCVCIYIYIMYIVFPMLVWLAAVPVLLLINTLSTLRIFSLIKTTHTIVYYTILYYTMT